jgi:hypothetical protein
MAEQRAASDFMLKVEAAQLKSSGSSSPTSQAERNATSSRRVAMLAVRMRGESPLL